MNEINTANSIHSEKSILSYSKHNEKVNQQTKKVQKAQKEKEKEVNPAPLSEKDIKELIHKENPEFNVEKLLEEIKKFNTGIDDKEIRLSYNEEIDRVIITVYKKKSNEVIKELPCEELQSLARHIKEMIGIFFDKEA